MPRTILVTGSSSGIGLTTTRYLLSLGHKVIGISRRKQEEASALFTHYTFDFSHLKALPPFLQTLEKNHPEIDFLFLNAGYGLISNLEEISHDSIERLISVNFTHHAMVTKAFLPLLKKKKHANIVYIASTSAHKGTKCLATYCASKFAIRGFAQAIRDECANTGVHVTIISPGVVRTPFFDNETVGPSDNPLEAIEPEDLNGILDLLLNIRHGTLIEEIVLRPIKTGIKKRSHCTLAQKNSME